MAMWGDKNPATAIAIGTTMHIKIGLGDKWNINEMEEASTPHPRSTGTSENEACLYSQSQRRKSAVTHLTTLNFQERALMVVGASLYQSLFSSFALYPAEHSSV
eukprot:1159216-Pelagomonas_calceolata.AAC.1